MTDIDLPSPIRVHVEEDRTASSRCDQGFIRVRRYVLRNEYTDGSISKPYPYDVVERDALDAVAILLYDIEHGEPRVCIRSALRPPLAFRPHYSLPVESDGAAVLWEIPAGLIERDEKGIEGVLGCAARETLEETGLDVPPNEFQLLGTPAALSPGVLAEMLYFVVGRVDASRRGEPSSDGSVVEERAEVLFVPLSQAMSGVKRGRIADVKTELGLRRFAEYWHNRNEGEG